MGRKLQVLFLCNANSARSLMGEALLNHMAGDLCEAFSAGVEPDAPHEHTLAALREFGIPTEGLASEPIERYADRHFDAVMILCEKAQQRCRDWQGRTDELIYWDIPDPRLHEGPTAYTRALRDIRGRLELWVAVKRRQQRRAEGSGVSDGGMPGVP